jgi:teichuronic acid biosynthesis glycosyltransferase TuaG
MSKHAPSGKPMVKGQKVALDSLVCIVMPVHNSARTVEEAIASVQAQTYPHWQLLVVNDASTDETVAIVKKLAAADERICLLERVKNGGPTVARNQALKVAEGRFVAFLDGDDVWLPHKLEKQVAVLEKSRHALCCTSYALMDHDGELTGRVRDVKARTYTLHDILTNNVIGCLTAVVDTHKTGPLQLATDYRIAEDYALWLSILQHGQTAVGISEVLAYYRLTRDSLSSRKLRAVQGVWKVFRHDNWMPWWKSAWYFSGYIVRRMPRVLERI